ncbi:crossover junction endonuclease MUS81 [Poecile atricapillus]|uniref:crossover junction endonuclease MUS81 n=1 Tax=Poecile atricapillus TaxID=48891 RepID=UPI0027388208|nr:crossover junction endonuclease MUS81 [Poecile atricapillus]
MAAAAAASSRRRRRPRAHPNPLFARWLREWRDEAQGTWARGAYERALRSLALFPLPLRSGRAAAILQHFGPALCARLDQRLRQHRREQGLPPTPPPPQGRCPAPPPAPPKRRPRHLRPLPRSAGHALLQVLSQSPEPLPEAELLQQAQPLCDHALGQAALAPLLRRGLVQRSGRPPRYSLTPRGRSLAEAPPPGQVRPQRPLAEQEENCAPSPTPCDPEQEFELRPGEFDIVLCADVTEANGPAGGVPALLRSRGVPLLLRRLHVGDFLWVAREKDPPTGRAPRELVLDVVVERKSAADLGNSVRDGRYHEQKFRLRRSGLRFPVYLLEEPGEGEPLPLPLPTLRQAAANTQVVDGFLVTRTRDPQDTAAYLGVLGEQLRRRFGGRVLRAWGGAVTARGPPEPPGTPLALLPFQRLREGGGKNQAQTVGAVFARQLLQLGGLSGGRAGAVLSRFPTPASLMAALGPSQDPQKCRELLSALRCGPRPEEPGPLPQRGPGAALRDPGATGLRGQRCHLQCHLGATSCHPLCHPCHLQCHLSVTPCHPLCHPCHLQCHHCYPLCHPGEEEEEEEARCWWRWWRWWPWRRGGTRGSSRPPRARWVSGRWRRGAAGTGTNVARPPCATTCASTTTAASPVTVTAASSCSPTGSPAAAAAAPPPGGHRHRPATPPRGLGGHRGQPATPPQELWGHRGQPATPPQELWGHRGQPATPPQELGGHRGQPATPPQELGGHRGQPATPPQELWGHRDRPERSRGWRARDRRRDGTGGGEGSQRDLAAELNRGSQEDSERDRYRDSLQDPHPGSHRERHRDLPSGWHREPRPGQHRDSHGDWDRDWDRDSDRDPRQVLDRDSDRDSQDLPVERHRGSHGDWDRDWDRDSRQDFHEHSQPSLQRDLHRDLPEDSREDLPPGGHRDLHRDLRPERGSHEDSHREWQQDLDRDRDPGWLEDFREASHRDLHRDSDRDGGLGAPRHRGWHRDSHRDSLQDSVRDSHRDSHRDSLQDSLRDPAPAGDTSPVPPYGDEDPDPYGDPYEDPEPQLWDPDTYGDPYGGPAPPYRAEDPREGPWDPETEPWDPDIYGDPYGDPYEDEETEEEPWDPAPPPSDPYRDPEPGSLRRGRDPQTRPWDPQSVPGDPQTRPWDPQSVPGDPQTRPWDPYGDGDPQSVPGDPQTRSWDPYGDPYSDEDPQDDPRDPHEVPKAKPWDPPRDPKGLSPSPRPQGSPQIASFAPQHPPSSPPVAPPESQLPPVVPAEDSPVIPVTLPVTPPVVTPRVKDPPVAPVTLPVAPVTLPVAPVTLPVAPPVAPVAPRPPPSGGSLRLGLVFALPVALGGALCHQSSPDGAEGEERMQIPALRSPITPKVRNVKAGGDKGGVMQITNTATPKGITGEKLGQNSGVSGLGVGGARERSAERLRKSSRSGSGRLRGRRGGDPGAAPGTAFGAAPRSEGDRERDGVDLFGINPRERSGSRGTRRERGRAAMAELWAPQNRVRAAVELR